MKIFNFRCKEWLTEPRNVCGLMTGTSLDGIDVAIAEFFSDSNGKHHFKIISELTVDFPHQIKDLIKKIIEEPTKISDISEFNFILSKLYAKAVLQLCLKSNFPPENLDAVGMHGQTVWHQPEKINITGAETTSTLQLGNPSVLAQILNVPVVGDFRSADVALGGQGAPLVPIFDFEFLSNKKENMIALNIGGISNITILPANSTVNKIKAFDTGPGNVLIDTVVKTYFNSDYDKNGKLARQGNVIPDFFDELQKIDFIHKAPPKSTGRELFNKELLFALVEKTSAKSQPKENIIRTLTEFTAWSISENIRLFANFIPDKVIISGGGVDNIFFVELLNNYMPNSKIMKIDELGIPSDAKEALCFAYLAYRTLGGLTSNIPSVTGASRNAILGVIAIP